jgi:EAL domain-containing protein (putative c-di-GMP-specific phosphodiesterase class I)
MGRYPDPSPFDLLDEAGHAFVDRVLASARDYLGARVSFLAEVVGKQKLIRAAHGPAQAAGVPAGMRFPLEDTYCQRVLSGTIPQAIFDARSDPRTCGLRLTRVLGIESYMGVPVVLPSGRVLGTLCCINFEPQPEQRDRDLGMMRFLADLLGRQLEDSVNSHALRRERDGAVRAVLAGGGPTMVYQPIVDLRSHAVVGVEALARFDTGPVQAGPEVWFREARAIGLGRELELAAVRAALRALAELPPTVYLAVNASPATLADPAFASLLGGVPPGRLVVEITEHAAVEDYCALVHDVGALRAAGVRVAVDDVGAGYSSLRHVLEVAPDIAKLDMSLTRHVDADLARQAMTQGVVAFASRMHVDVVAEGVETPAEAATLDAAGVRYAQGYHFARPASLPVVLHVAGDTLGVA